MGGLGSNDRVQAFKSKFNEVENNMPAYHYCTHYSSPEIVLNYL